MTSRMQPPRVSHGARFRYFPQPAADFATSQGRDWPDQRQHRDLAHEPSIGAPHEEYTAEIASSQLLNVPEVVGINVDQIEPAEIAPEHCHDRLPVVPPPSHSRQSGIQGKRKSASALAFGERDSGNLSQLRAENKALKKQVEKLRDALAPFACLGVKELRPGDTNRARRALAIAGGFS